MDMDFEITESRCRICSLPSQLRQIIDNLLLKDDKNLDTIYFYLSGVCRTYNIKTPSRSSLLRHYQRHVRKDIDFKELKIDSRENLVADDVTYDALMYALHPEHINESEFKTLYSTWITEWNKPIICTAEEFHRRLKLIFDKAIPDKSTKLLQYFVRYIEDHNPSLNFVWSGS